MQLPLISLDQHCLTLERDLSLVSSVRSDDVFFAQVAVYVLYLTFSKLLQVVKVNCIQLAKLLISK